MSYLARRWDRFKERQRESDFYVTPRRRPKSAKEYSGKYVPIGKRRERVKGCWRCEDLADYQCYMGCHDPVVPEHGAHCACEICF